MSPVDDNEIFGRIGKLSSEKFDCKSHLLKSIGHFTVVCLVTWPLNGSEVGVDLVLIQTSLLLFCKSSCFDANWFAFT